MADGGLGYAIAADLILIIHFAFVLFVLLSVPVIWLGFFLKKRFVHNPIFRISHLLAMGLVFAQTLFGNICPLTTWEARLRLRSAVGRAYPGSFIQYWVHKIMFYQVGIWTLQWVYALFFALILFTLIVVRLRWRRSEEPM